MHIRDLLYSSSVIFQLCNMGNTFIFMFRSGIRTALMKRTIRYLLLMRVISTVVWNILYSIGRRGIKLSPAEYIADRFGLPITGREICRLWNVRKKYIKPSIPLPILIQPRKLQCILPGCKTGRFKPFGEIFSAKFKRRFAKLP